MLNIYNRLGTCIWGVKSRQVDGLMRAMTELLRLVVQPIFKEGQIIKVTAVQALLSLQTRAVLYTPPVATTD